MIILIMKIRIIPKYLNKFYNILLNKDLKYNSMFLILIMISISAVIYNLFTNYKFNINFFSDTMLMFTLIAIGIIFIINKSNYNQLSSEYDILLTNVKNFEEWIEKEQFTRHEYKNQLAVLYAISNQKSVKQKIEEIISQNLNIESEVVHNIKTLPKGGLKGLLYYKTIVAQNQKIKVTIDVSINDKGILHKLSKDEVTTLSKLIGIFYDNAIEAASETRKKVILVEIYELKDKVNIVISNTFKKNSIPEKNQDKGVSSKGVGRGNGLYFAQKINKANDWIAEKHEIIDNYYIETITIKKKKASK